LFNHAKPILLSLSALAFLSGCSSMLNTAGSGEYGCPGMPNGVVCKTPAAVYKSTHLDPVQTSFDTPIGSPDVGQTSTAPAVQAAGLPHIPAVVASKTASGPRPVREAAKVARIWIAPWVDKNDNLHLAQTQYTEIKPRTWTVGKPEVAAGSGYVIPHRAFEGIAVPRAEPNERGDVRPSEGVMPPATSRASQEANSLDAPPN
jgi:conjugal transfer pilus assembly protein TraV